MALIKLSAGGFSLLPEGTSVFKITAVDYDEDFGRMIIEMNTQNGQKHSERFTLLNGNGEVNDKALRAFSYFAKTALNNYSVEEIDESDLIGCYIQADVKHREYPKSDGTTGKAVQLSNYTASVGFPAKAKTDWSKIESFLND